MNCHNSNSYICESEFDNVSVPIAKKVDAVASDVYLIESDKQVDSERTVTRISEISENLWNYSGVSYTNCFRASKPIRLTSVGFFGPALTEEYEGPVAYVVDIQIEELLQKVVSSSAKKCSSNYGNRVAKAMTFTVKASTTEPIFYVNFPVPVNILQNVWYAIKFCLEGPDTFRGANTLDRAFSPDDGIQFDFFQGSLQMPVIKYMRHLY